MIVIVVKYVPHSPIDINECQEGVCSQLCNNTDGGFRCDCLSGFQLAPSGRSCLGDYSCLNLNA